MNDELPQLLQGSKGPRLTWVKLHVQDSLGNLLFNSNPVYVCVGVWRAQSWAADPCSAGKAGWAESATTVIVEKGSDKLEVAWVLCRGGSASAYAPTYLPPCHTEEISTRRRQQEDATQGQRDPSARSYSPTYTHEALPEKTSLCH